MYKLLASASLAPLRFFELVLRLFSCFWMVLWCGHTVPPFPSCDLDSVSIHWSSGCVSVGWCHSWLPICHCSFLSFWNTLAMGMVTMLWFWNFSGIFLPSLRLDLSGLGVGMPSQGPELSLNWLDPLSFLSLLLCIWSDLLLLVFGISCAHLYFGMLVKSFLSFSTGLLFLSTFEILLSGLVFSVEVFLGWGFSFMLGWGFGPFSLVLC